MKVIICGGRTYNNHVYMKSKLDTLEITTIISGNAQGADRWGEMYARDNGISLIIIPADWDKHGRVAGPIRNQKMLDENPDMVIAFPGGKGTAHMIKIAKVKGTIVWEP